MARRSPITAVLTGVVNARVEVAYAKTDACRFCARTPVLYLPRIPPPEESFDETILRGTGNENRAPVGLTSGARA